MQFGRLFLVADAAHIVPLTGATGMNLAVADARVLAEALVRFYATGDRAGLDDYSASCLRRVWRAEYFSWWMTTMLHRHQEDRFMDRLGISNLRYVISSEAATERSPELHRLAIRLSRGPALLEVGSDRVLFSIDWPFVDNEPGMR